MTLHRPDLVKDGRDAVIRPRMRRFEIDTLLPCGTAVMDSRRAPALPDIESCASAFARGTLVPTVTGPCAIEDLRPGDRVATADGRDARVMWIGSLMFDPDGPTDEADTGTDMDRLFRVPADPHGDGDTAMDLLLGPAARCAIRHPRLEALLGRQAVLVPITDEVDFDRIVPVRPPGPVQLFHLLLDRHALLRVGPLEIESYHPGRALEAIAAAGLRDAFLGLFPQIGSVAEFGQLSFSRTTREAIDSVLTH